MHLFFCPDVMYICTYICSIYSKLVIGLDYLLVHMNHLPACFYTPYPTQTNRLQEINILTQVDSLALGTPIIRYFNMSDQEEDPDIAGEEEEEVEEGEGKLFEK